MTMDARKQRVLQAIVALYGLEGEPVGSSVLANYFDMAVSSATLRNEMAALTKLGLLEQPHTSAGRVPSAKGYRYYLDNLLADDQPLDRVTRARVDAVFASLDHEPEKLAAGAARALAAISGCTAAVSTPCAEDLCIAHYEVVQVGRSAAAVLAVTTAGYVRTRVARVRTGLSRENAAALAALLNRNLTFVAPVDLSTRLLAELCSQIDPELVPVISAAAAILQDGSRRADDGHQLRVDLAAQLCQQPGGKIHRRYKGKVAVEQCGKCCRILAGEAGAHPCHTGTDVTGRGNGQHSRCAAAHLNHFIVGDAQVFGTWGADGGGAAADGGQRPGGTCGQLFRLMVEACEHRIHTGAGHTVQRLIVGKQIIKVVTVALGTGHTARAGVGLLQQTQLGQRRHFVAQRGAGHGHIKIVCQHTAAHRLALEAIQRHDRLQDSLLACIHRHSACLLFAFALFV